MRSTLPESTSYRRLNRQLKDKRGMKRYIFILSVLCTFAAANVAAQEQETETVIAADSAATEQPSEVNAAASDAETLWEAANAAYVNGAYERAAEGYQAILARGLHSANLYYNLANAYFKSGRTGQAILYYHRALRLAPGSDDIRYNLEVAEENTKDSIEAVPEFFLTTWMRTVRNTMSSTVWSVLSLVALAAMLALAMLYMLASRLEARKAGFYGMVAALAIFVAATSFAASGRREMVERNDAVVMSSSVSVKSSPDNSATDLFVLHEGTTVKVTARLDEWSEIVIADGKKGWVRSRQIEII